MNILNNGIIMYGTTSHNRTVTVRRLTAARLRKTPVGACAPLCRFAPPQFCVCEKLLRSFLYRKHKTVSYRRNVMRKFYLEIFSECNRMRIDKIV